MPRCLDLIRETDPSHRLASFASFLSVLGVFRNEPLRQLLPVVAYVPPRTCPAKGSYRQYPKNLVRKMRFVI